jgi:hypothetical protein
MSSCASSMGSRPPPRPSRIFIDTSVLFAAALSDTGFARDLIFAGARGELDLVLSTFVIEETRRNLAAKAPSDLPFFETFVALELRQVVDPPAALARQVAWTSCSRTRQSWLGRSTPGRNSWLPTTASTCSPKQVSFRTDSGLRWDHRRLSLPPLARRRAGARWWLGMRACGFRPSHFSPITVIPRRQ